METTRFWLGFLLVAVAILSRSKGQTPAPVDGQEEGDPMGYHQDNACDANWDQWGQWSDCNAHCNQAGQRVRYRNCIRPSDPKCHTPGYFPDCQGKDMVTRSCLGECAPQPTHDECKIDQKGGWGSWGCWSQCKSGVKIRFRKCDHPEPIGDHSYCHGSYEEKDQCTTAYHPATSKPDPYPPAVTHKPNPYPPATIKPNPYPPSHNPNPNPYPSPNNPNPYPSPNNPNPYPSPNNPNPYPSPNNPNPYPSPNNPNPYPSPNNPNPYPSPNNPNPYPPSHNPIPYPPSHNPNNNYPTNNYPPPACVKGQDIIFAVDSSGSIGHADYQKMTTSLLSLIAAFDLDYHNSYDSQKVRTGIIVFSDYAYNVKELKNYQTPSSLTYYDGATNTAAAIELAYKEMFQQSRGDRDQNPNVLVIVTDGQSSDTAKTMAAANYAKSARIQIIAVGIGQNVDQYELRSMASDPGKDVYNINQFDQIPQEFGRMFKC